MLPNFIGQQFKQRTAMQHRDHNTSPIAALLMWQGRVK
jgi:hypothetical protein